MGANPKAPWDAVEGERHPNGYFKKGHVALAGSGRPKGIDFKTTVLRAIQEHGATEAIVKVWHAMLNAALDGDVAAARLILDRMCGKEADVVELTSGLSDDERAARVQELLDAARERRAEIEQGVAPGRAEQNGAQPGVDETLRRMFD